MLKVLYILLLMIPAIIFYSILWKNALNLPIGADDYHAVIQFANEWLRLHGFIPKLLQIITFQHNEYKLIFASSIVAMQCALLGHVEFYSLIALGNSFVLLLFLSLISIQQTLKSSAFTKLLHMLPISLLLFQLQYASTLDSAMMGLENVAVLFFSLLSINLLCGKSQKLFALACLAMLMSIASSGNGFMAAATGCMLLFQQKRWKQFTLWMCLILATSMIYFYRYNFYSSQSTHGANVVRLSTHFSLLYSFSFLGSSVARYQSCVPSVILGVVLCSVVGLAIWKRYYLKNAAVFYSIIFIIITAICVSGLRSDFGIVQSLASRYRIYSNLLLILVYMLLCEIMWPVARSYPVLRRSILTVTIMLCIGFCGISDLAGASFLAGRRLAVMCEMNIWQHSDVKSVAALPADLNPAIRRQMNIGLYKPDSAALSESIRLGTYRLPFQAPRCDLVPEKHIP